LDKVLSKIGLPKTTVWLRYPNFK